MPRPLDPAEEEVVALLQRIGLSRGAARSLGVLLRGGRFSRQDVADVSGLLTQEVSEGMRDLERRGVVVREPAPSMGKGRPQLRHGLAASAGEAVRALVAARRRELQAEMLLLDELDARFT